MGSIIEPGGLRTSGGRGSTAGGSTRKELSLAVEMILHFSSAWWYLQNKWEITAQSGDFTIIIAKPS